MTGSWSRSNPLSSTQYVDNSLPPTNVMLPLVHFRRVVTHSIFPTFKHSNLPYSRDEMQRADTCTHDRTHTHTCTRTHMYFVFLNTARATCGKSCHRYLKRQEKSQAAMMWSRWPKPCQRCTSTSTPSLRRKPGPCTGLAPCWS